MEDTRGVIDERPAVVQTAPPVLPGGMVSIMSRISEGNSLRSASSALQAGYGTQMMACIVQPRLQRRRAVIKPPPREHTWQDEKDMLRTHAKRISRMEASLRESNLRMWAVKSGCVVASTMTDRKNLATQLVGLVGDESGLHLDLHKLEDLLLVLRQPEMLHKVRKYLREKRRQASAEASARPSGPSGKPEAELISLDEFILLVGTDFHISRSCHNMKQVVLSHDPSREHLDYATIYSEYRRQCILRGLHYHSSPQLTGARKLCRLVVQLERAGRDTRRPNSEPTATALSHNATVTGLSSSTSNSDTLDPSISTQSTTSSSGLSWAIVSAPPAVQEPADQGGVDIDDTSSEEHTSVDQTSLEPSQPPAPTPHLSHYLRGKELLGTDREQDPLDHEGMKSFSVTKPAAALLSEPLVPNDEYRGREAEPTRLAEGSQTSRQVTVAPGGMTLAIRTSKAGVTMAHRTAAYAGSATASNLTRRHSSASPIAHSGDSTSSCSTIVQVKAKVGRRVQLRNLPVLSPWGKLLNVAKKEQPSQVNKKTQLKLNTIKSATAFPQKTLKPVTTMKQATGAVSARWTPDAKAESAMLNTRNAGSTTTTQTARTMRTVKKLPASDMYNTSAAPLVPFHVAGSTPEDTERRNHSDDDGAHLRSVRFA